MNVLPLRCVDRFPDVAVCSDRAGRFLDVGRKIAAVAFAVDNRALASLLEPRIVGGVGVVRFLRSKTLLVAG